MAVQADAAESLVEQLDREKRTVSYDAYDITVRQIIDMVHNKEIDIAPEYQRRFIWKPERESELIESIYLGIPVPSLFMAANKDGTWEVVDGVQRLSTLLHFCGTDQMIQMIGRTERLQLSELGKLATFNGKAFDDLPKSVQLAFTLRPLRITTLNDKSDLDIRYELFERLNTGGVLLHPQEIRNCIYRGKFGEDLKPLSRDKNFRKVVRLRANEQTEAGYEECVLRFFAFFNNYREFEHLVAKFLNDFTKEHDQKGLPENQLDIFHRTMAFLVAELPQGIVRGRTTTPINLYEAIAVGTALALAQTGQPKTGVLPGLLRDNALRQLTQSGTNTRPMVVGRIELVRDALV
jgi:hypothetical protein